MLRFLREDKGINGPVRKISTFADFTNDYIKKDVKEACRSTGVKLNYVPGGEDAANIALLEDLSWFIYDNPPPHTIILISGDSDFVPFLCQLKEHRYNVVNVTPKDVSKNRKKKWLTVWEWPDFARGGCVLPSYKRKETRFEERTSISTLSTNYKRIDSFAWELIAPGGLVSVGTGATIGFVLGLLETWFFSSKPRMGKTIVNYSRNYMEILIHQ